MGFTVKSFDKLVEDMVAYMVANSSQITDMTPGSVIRSFCEGAGLCLEEIYVAVYLGFKRYLDNIEETVFGFTKKAGTKASTNVIFSRTGTSGDKTIPIGHRNKTVSGLRFITTAVATIANGNTDSNAVEVIADKVGIAYNVALNTIIVMEDDINGVDSVTNANAATGGVDSETAYNFKKRFQAYIEGLGKTNIAGLIYGALSVEGITSVSAVELFPPVGNVNVKIYVDDSTSGGISNDLLAEVQNIINGDGTADNPGYRSAGVNVVAVKPGIVTKDITATVYVISGIDTDQVETDINTALTSYVNNLGVGADIIYNELVVAIMSVYGVTNVNVVAPANDEVIGDTQVGRAGIITITIG